MHTINAQIVNIPDANLKAILLNANVNNKFASKESLSLYDINSSHSWSVINYHKIDSNNDGQIQVSEALEIKYLDLKGGVGGNWTTNVSNLTGLEQFTNLEYLKCSYCLLTQVNLPNLSKLRVFACDDNRITSINLPDSYLLDELLCNYNQLTSLDISNKTGLKFLYFHHNNITNIDLSSVPFLRDLSCSFNNISNLNLSNVPYLMVLDANNNTISSLNLQNLSYLLRLYCSYNQLTSLDVSNCNKLHHIFCNNNQLTSLNIRNLNRNNGFNGFLTAGYFNFDNNPNLRYVCADDEYTNMVQQKLDVYLYTNCHVNSYCSFVPGGTHYTINGVSPVDANNNGCDALDLKYAGLKFNLSDGVNTGMFIADNSGSYSIPVTSGTHTITPQLENPSYFTIFPTTYSVNFPNQSSPYTQDFCITPNGLHPDLEIKIFPVGVARPGFDATYEIFYKNKGTQALSPEIVFNFNDELMDFISSTLAPNSQGTGLLKWNIGAISSMSSGSFRVKFNINTPTEVPPVNGNDVLSYTATINDVNFVDEISTDNSFILNQTVVNAYDPNDKICLEGKIIHPSKIGDYVHYQIRFENTGNFPATNIVVKDIIDQSMFDINSLQLIKSSHNCYTKIKGNQVEFIFENINLPFQDATNDGYLVFKIKSLSTLSSGSTVTNKANIYFDYNYPITTNLASTIYDTVFANESFNFNDEFAIFPNPVKNILTIKSTNSLQITSIEIYNMLGQVILSSPDFKDSLDISSFDSGTYFVKVNTSKGSTITKFIKE